MYGLSRSAPVDLPNAEVVVVRSVEQPDLLVLTRCTCPCGSFLGLQSSSFNILGITSAQREVQLWKPDLLSLRQLFLQL